MRLLTAVLTLFVFAVPAPGQTAAQLKRELRDKETAAKKDPDALLEVGKWAAEKGLAADAKRIYQNVLRIDPGHAGANEALGNELVDGKWLTAADAKALRDKAREAEFKARGMVQVAGVWVEKDHVEDARRGVFHLDGRLWTKDEYEALTSGMVRHPVTGEIIEAKHLEAAQERRFPIGTEGRWADEQDANHYHRDPQRPWIVHTHNCVLISTLPIAKLEEVTHFADRGVERVQPILGMRRPRPAERPTIVIAATESEFNDWGQRLGDETSAYAVFLAEEGGTVHVPLQGDVRPVVCHMHELWGPYHIRHAAAMGHVAGLCVESGARLPLWCLHAFGALASRFDSPGEGGYFGKQHMKLGGVPDLQSWFNSFAINADKSANDLEINIYEAGLVLSFAAEGGNDAAIEAVQELTEAFDKGRGKAIEKAADKLRDTVVREEAALNAWLQELIRKSG